MSTTVPPTISDSPFPPTITPHLAVVDPGDVKLQPSEEQMRATFPGKYLPCVLFALPSPRQLQLQVLSTDFKSGVLLKDPFHERNPTMTWGRVIRSMNDPIVALGQLLSDVILPDMRENKWSCKDVWDLWITGREISLRHEMAGTRHASIPALQYFIYRFPHSEVGKDMISCLHEKLCSVPDDKGRCNGMEEKIEKINEQEKRKLAPCDVKTFFRLVNLNHRIRNLAPPAHNEDKEKDEYMEFQETVKGNMALSIQEWGRYIKTVQNRTWPGGRKGQRESQGAVEGK